MKGEQGIQGEKGDKGDQGEKGEQGIQGEQGEKGEDAIYCYISSTKGNTFEANETGTTNLTAHLFIGAEEQDISGTKYTYEWKVLETNGNISNLTDSSGNPYTGKTLTGVSLTILKNKTIFFEATEK
jgi:hypothetical protein